MTPESTVSSAPPLSPPGPSEQRAIDEAVVRVSERSPRFALRMRQNSENRIEILGAEHSDHQGWLTRLEDTFGSRGQAFPISSLNRLMTACREKDGKVDVVKLNGTLAMIEGAKPRNEIEAALAVQMAKTHAAAQQLLARSLSVDQIPQFDSAANAASRLLRTFALLAETLAKLQRGGEQVVKVVHIHPGARPSSETSRRAPLAPPGRGPPMKSQINPMQRGSCQPVALGRCRKCGARTRAGSPCRSPAVAGKARCRMHGGALGSGAPAGKRNGAYRSGWFTRDMIAERRQLAELTADGRAFARLVSGA